MFQIGQVCNPLGKHIWNCHGCFCNFQVWDKDLENKDIISWNQLLFRSELNNKNSAHLVVLYIRRHPHTCRPFVWTLLDKHIQKHLKKIKKQKYYRLQSATFSDQNSRELFCGHLNCSNQEIWKSINHECFSELSRTSTSKST